MSLNAKKSVLSSLPGCSLLLALLCLLPTTAAVAAGRDQGSEGKKAWQWTLDERLERRFAPGITISSVDGRREPELLLPGELFRWLLWQGYSVGDVETRNIWRRSFAQEAVASGLGRDFLDHLERVAAEGIRAQQEHMAYLEAYSQAKGSELRRMDAELEVRQEASCAAQAKALAAARAHFGTALFDRYLYDAVAPVMGRVTHEASNQTWLRRQESGCLDKMELAASQEVPPTSVKQPWEWALEERLERRFDPQDMDRRLAEAAVRANRPAPEPGATVSTVNGRREPELLLPSEIFERLLRLAFALTSNPENREIWRTGFAQGAIKLGFGEGFLDELEQVAAEAIRAQRSQVVHPSEHQASCAAQAKALAAARAHFGRLLFDRYLYEVIALDMEQATHGFEAEETLRWREAGCP